MSHDDEGGSGPLAGIRVIDLTSHASGPIATAILADQGADVVKIERPGSGDLMRSLGAVRNGMSSIFATLNRNKRSVAVDIARPEGRDIVRRLAREADVVAQNFRPGTVDRLGLGEPALRAENSDLVYLSISGFGESGPYADRRAYDSVVQAISGMAAHQADPSDGRPRFIRNAICDKVTGLTAAQLVTAALFVRARGGGGQHVRLSMLDAALHFLWADGMQNVAFTELDEAGAGPRAVQPPVRRTADGYLAISANQDSEFRNLCTVLGLDALADDPRFAAAGERSRRADELFLVVDPVVERWATADLAAALTAADVPHSVVNTLEDMHDDPQVRHAGLLAELDQPPIGRMRQPAPVGSFSAGATAIGRPAPLLGQHGDEVLAELGIDDAARAALREAGTIG